jgi:hypothetical protein
MSTDSQPTGIDRRWASRKFALACAGWLAGVVFFAMGKMDAAQWLTQSAWVLGLYMAGNVGDSAVTR